MTPISSLGLPTTPQVNTPRKDNDVAKKVAQPFFNNFVVHRHNARVKTFLGFDIAEASNNNFKRLKDQLRRGSQYLESCITIDGMSYGLLEIEEMQYPGLLNQRETILFEFLISHLTLKHATSSIGFFKESKEMLSLKERERKKMPIANSHTSPQLGVDDVIYFVGGVGRHPTPPFLEDEATHIIRLKVDQMLKEDEETTKRFWCSGHLSDYLQELPSELINAGGSLYEYTHNWDERKKDYRVKREDGTEFRWSVKYEEECFLGGHVAPGIAFQLILLFRFLGFDNPYVNKVYDLLINDFASVEEKEECLSTAMTTFFPGWVYPEAKIISHLDISKPYVDISPIKEINPLESWKVRCHKAVSLIEASSKGDIEKVKYLLSQGLSPNLRMRDSDKTPVMEAIEKLKNRPEKALQMVQFLVEHGANPALTASRWNNMNALHVAIKEGLSEVVDYLLENEYSLEDEPLIKIKIRPDCKGSKEGNAISLACCQNDETLEVLLKHGADVVQHGHIYMNEAAEKENWRAVKLLADAGVKLNPDIIQWGMTALMSTAQKGHKKAVRFLLRQGADPDIPFRVRLYHVFLGRYFYSSEDNGNTALHFAAKAGKTGSVKVLLQAGASPNLKNCSGETALDLAQKHPKVAELLAPVTTNKMAVEPPSKIHKKIQFNANEPHQVVSLVTSVSPSGKKCILMGRKRDEDGLACNEYVFPGGAVDASDESLEKASLRELQEETGLKVNAEPRYLASVSFQKEFLLTNTTFFHIECGKSFNQRKTIPGDDLIEVRMIPLDSIVCQNENETPPTYLCSLDNVPIRLSNAILAKHVMDSPIPSGLLPFETIVKIEEEGNLMLSDAAKKNEIEEIKMLLKYGVKDKHVMGVDTAPLCSLLEHRNYEAIELLLQAGFDINVQTGGVFTSVDKPLLRAVRLGDIRLVAYLLAKGARPTSRGNEVPDAFLQAIISGDLEIIKLLYNQPGCNVNFANNNDSETTKNRVVLRSPMEFAIKYDHRSVMRFLVEEANENVSREKTPIKRHTMLQTAIRYDRKEIALYLLALQTSNLSICAKSKQTAYDLAIEKGWEDVAKIITFYQENHNLSSFLNKNLLLNPKHLQWHLDENQEHTLHVYFEKKLQAEVLRSKVGGVIREDHHGFYLRLGKIRLKTLIGDEDIANFLFKHSRESIFWEISPYDYRSILEDQLDTFCFDNLALHCNWNYLCTLLRQNRSITDLVIDFAVIPEEKYPEIAQIFKSNDLITSLVCRNFRFTEEATQLISTLVVSLPSLSRMILPNKTSDETSCLNLVETIVRSRKNDKNLDSIQFSASGFTPNFFIKLQELIVSTSSVTEFDALEATSSTMQKLKQTIERVQWEQAYKNSSDNFKKLIKALYLNKDCFHIELEGSEYFPNKPNFNLTEHHMSLFIHALSHNTTLQELKISYYTCNTKLFNVLARCIEKHPSIRSLNFQGCDLSNRRVKLICDLLLRRGKQMNHLNLQSNRKIKSEGIGSINHLLNNSVIKLKSLNMEMCNLDDQELEILCKGIEQSQYLKILQIDMNDFTEVGFETLSKSLKNNNSMTILNYRDWPFKFEYDKVIEKILERNRKFELSQQVKAEGIFDHVSNHPSAIHSHPAPAPCNRCNHIYDTLN